MAVQSMEVIGEKSDTVVDRDERLARQETRGTILESPINVEPLLLHRSDELVQKTLFQERLEEIDHELSKFDNEAVKGVAVENSEVMIHQQESEDKEVNGLRPLGLSSSPSVVKEKGKNKERGWVHRERIQVEPIGQHSSILSKRVLRDENVETEEIEGNKKKVAKSDIILSVEVGSQPRRN